MLRKDNFYGGLIVGLMAPFMLWIILHETGVELDHLRVLREPFTYKFLAATSICANAIPATIFYKRRRDNSLRGIMLITFILVFIAIILFAKQWFYD